MRSLLWHGDEAAKHLGIGVCSAKGAALCCRTTCGEAPRQRAEHLYPKITVHTRSLDAYMAHGRSGYWEGFAEALLSFARKGPFERGAEKKPNMA